MDDWVECPQCHFLRDHLHTIPTCSKCRQRRTLGASEAAVTHNLACAECIHSRLQCPCGVSGDDAVAAAGEAYVPLQAMMRRVLRPCSHGCGHDLADALRESHEKHTCPELPEQLAHTGLAPSPKQLARENLFLEFRTELPDHVLQAVGLVGGSVDRPMPAMSPLSELLATTTTTTTTTMTTPGAVAAAAAAAAATTDAEVAAPVASAPPMPLLSPADLERRMRTPSPLPMASNDPNFFNHVVTDRDTLLGLSLRYKVSLQDLRKANHLLGDDSIHGRWVLRIPRRDGQQLSVDVVEVEQALRARMQCRFRQLTGCREQETAFYYLDLHLWSLKRAMAEFREDEAWLAANPRQPAGARRDLSRRTPHHHADDDGPQQRRTVCSLGGLLAVEACV